MFPNFLPTAVGQLTEPTSIALARSIQTTAIATPLTNQPVTTTFVKQGCGRTPILLIHGFDSSVLEFRRLLPLLSGDNETWAVDLLGFGFTDRLSGIAYSPTAIKTHLNTARLRKRKGKTKKTLFAYDLREQDEIIQLT
ncbi:MAG: alpha/beta fold hydrolase, partial [Nostoc sp.]|uniref:alpha/beta fold hydrolase n=1 Tax=Nostoc sp. TaxID=1180 RepID=UPI002FFAFCC7